MPDRRLAEKQSAIPPSIRGTEARVVSSDARLAVIREPPIADRGRDSRSWAPTFIVAQIEAALQAPDTSPNDDFE